MKLLLLLPLFLNTVAKAQTELFIFSGINKSYVSIEKTRLYWDTYTQGNSWQAGLQVRHFFSGNAFVRTGLSLTSAHFNRNFLSGADITILYDYKPLFFTIPFHIGYQLFKQKKIGVGFYAGSAYAMGVGGKVKEFIELYYPNYSQYSLQRKATFSNKKDANSYDADFARHQFLFLSGIEIGLKKLKIDFTYNHAISNLVPRGETEYEIQKVRSSSLSLKYYLFQF